MSTVLLGRPVAVCMLGALVLLSSSSISAQSPGLEPALSSLVHITGTRQGTSLSGSGFVVALGEGMATVVTSSHVIEGADFAVTFGVAETKIFQVSSRDVIKIETENRNGLAVFLVRGDLPARLQALELAGAGVSPSPGDRALFLGYPEMASAPRTQERVYSGRDGSRYVFDGEVGEGISGGPVVLLGKAIGLVTDTSPQFTYAVSFTVVREFLTGSAVKLSDPAPTVRTDTPPVAPSVRPFQNDFLVATVDSVSFSQDTSTSYINLTLNLENRTARDEFLVCVRSYLLDNQGSEWGVLRDSGLVRNISNWPLGPGSFSRVSPDVHLPIPLRFTRNSAGQSARPAMINLEMDCYRRRGDSAGYIGEGCNTMSPERLAIALNNDTCVRFVYEQFSIVISRIPVDGW
jgi:hypothetical protein